MTRTQRKALYAVLSVAVLLLALEAGFAAVVLGGAFLLIGLGFFLGWQTRGDVELAKWVYGLMPPDDEPPEKIRV